MSYITLVSLGCAKNQVDSEIMISSLCQEGFSYVETPEAADIIIVNTCGFIEPAKEESIVTGLELKARFPGKKIILAGCLTERYKETLKKELPEIDGFFGNKNPETAGIRVKQIINSTGSGKMEENPVMPGTMKRTRLLSYPGSAYVKIAEGCNNRCAYCTIPDIRGELKSRPVKEISDEIREFLYRGIVEINLVAQDTGSFGLDKDEGENIISLLATLSRIDGRFWIRLLYIHPDRFQDNMLELFKTDARFLPYFDLPFQHASPRILKMMGRKGNADSYLHLIKKIRKELPDAVIRSTFLTGFPGETDEDFHILTDFQHRAELTWLGIFTYSREEGTPAFSFPGKVRKTTAEKRKRLLEQNQIRITEQALSRFVGKELDVLIEEPVKNEGMFIGRGYFHAPDVDGLVVVNGTGLVPGTIVHTRIIRQNNLDLEAVVL
ncbi:MAG: 30S ribosomal protein S12 methylthiotransferase RimO [Spirochaetales bacterium]|nr:30S ribosomal protein S12 methylthiotransferase RimO [Spirochaetales bacterium]